MNWRTTSCWHMSKTAYTIYSQLPISWGLLLCSYRYTLCHGEKGPFNIVQKPNGIYLHLHCIRCLFYLPELILVDSPSAKVSTMVARSLAAEDEIADKSVWGSRNAWTTTDSSPAGVDEDWLSPVTATIASARATDKTLSAIASAACYSVKNTSCETTVSVTRQKEGNNWLMYLKSIQQYTLLLASIYQMLKALPLPLCI